MELRQDVVVPVDGEDQIPPRHPRLLALALDVVSSNLLSCKQQLWQKVRLLGRAKSKALGLVMARDAGAILWRGDAMGIRSQLLKTNRRVY